MLQYFSLKIFATLHGEMLIFQQDNVIQQDDEIRIKIVGLRVDATDIVIFFVNALS